jgi:hypothetical protein
MQINGRYMSDNEWCAQQEPVYSHGGALVGYVVPSVGGTWSATDVAGHHAANGCRSRAEAIARVQGWARELATSRGSLGAAPASTVSPEQVTGMLMAGAALVGALGALMGSSGDQVASPQASDDLRQQNELLRQQNELLRQALLGKQPQALKRR